MPRKISEPKKDERAGDWKSFKIVVLQLTLTGKLNQRHRQYVGKININRILIGKPPGKRVREGIPNIFCKWSRASLRPVCDSYARSQKNSSKHRPEQNYRHINRKQ
jgi:hypothetical protein